MSMAEKFSEMFDDDGSIFSTDDGRSFEEVAGDMKAEATYSKREYLDDGEINYVDGYCGEHFGGDPIRYEFPDGSAIVVAGDAWDFEGDHRFEFAG